MASTPQKPVTLWNDDAEPLRIVNRGDLQEGHLKRQLGLDRVAFGQHGTPTSDREEIRRRQRALAPFLSSRDAPSSDDIRRVIERSKIPLDGWDFTRHFENELFWGELDALLDNLRQVAGSDDETPELNQFLAFVDENRNRFYQREKEFADAVISQLRKMMEFSARVSVETTGFARLRGPDKTNVYTHHVIGSRRYRYHPDDMEWSPPLWSEHPLAYYTGVHALCAAACGIHNYLTRLRSWRPALITQLPPEVVEFLRTEIPQMMGSCPEPAEEHDKLVWELYITYDHDGLRVWLLDAYGKQRPLSSVAVGGDWSWKHFSWHQELPFRQRRRHTSEVRKVLIHANNNYFRSLCFRVISEEYPALFDKTGMTLPSDELDRTFRFRQLDQVIKGNQERREAEKTVEQNRAAITEVLEDLRYVAEIAESLRARAGYWKLDLQFPTILAEHDHRISFSRLDPVHLIGRKDPHGNEVTPGDLTPLEAPFELNGQIVGLAGEHAGGKTAIEESVAAAVWMAQCGLPVFGYRVELNPKTMLALGFIERGEQSVADTLARKANEAVKAAKENDPARMLAILDELGGGTQEEKGHQLGRLALERLRETGCSVLFSSQITRLMEDAQHGLSAEILSVRRDHSIEQGILRGDIDGLIRDRGYNELLPEQA